MDYWVVVASTWPCTYDTPDICFFVLEGQLNMNIILLTIRFTITVLHPGDHLNIWYEI